MGYQASRVHIWSCRFSTHAAGWKRSPIDDFGLEEDEVLFRRYGAILRFRFIGMRHRWRNMWARPTLLEAPSARAGQLSVMACYFGHPRSTIFHPRSGRIGDSCAIWRIWAWWGESLLVFSSRFSGKRKTRDCWEDRGFVRVNPPRLLLG